MNSRLYKCWVMHSRLSPVKHWFIYNTFMFYLDLDEIEIFSKTLGLFSWNRFNIYNFRDTDHMQIGGTTVKQNILKYLGEQGIKEEIGKVMLLTNVATFGYNFNPVSFYFCFDRNGEPVSAVAEVGNTFGELKPYFIGKNNLNGKTFKANIKKYFYVSPFTELDAAFDFRLTVPGSKLTISIDDYKNSEKFFKSRLVGEEKLLNDFNLFIYALKFPLITIKVIAAIHWQALKLYLKKLPYHKKNENLQLQRGVLKNAGSDN